MIDKIKYKKHLAQYLCLDKIKDIDIDNLILKIILLFPISTVIQGISIFSPINKILTGILLLMLFFISFRNINIKCFFIETIILSLSLVGMILSEDFSINLNNFFYFPMFGVFSMYLAKEHKKFKQKIKENISFIKLIIISWNILVFISLFIKSSYKLTWGNLYFASFSNDIPHRFASSCTFILILIFVWLKDTKKEDESKFNRLKKYSLCILPVVSVLLSGARVYLIVLCLILVSIYYNECKTSRFFWKTIIPLGIIGILIILVSPMGNKMLTVLNNQYVKDLLSAFTSGRSEFWVYDLKYFFKSNIYFQLFGNGVSFIFNVNHAAIGMDIYAHNDFINILLSYGYVGLIIYIITIIYTVKCFFKDEKIKTKLFFVTIFGIYFSCAVLNGFYVYVCTLLSIPFIMYCNLEKEE